MINPSQRMRDDPAAQAAHIITRLAIILLLIVAPVASVSTRSAVYVLVPVGVSLTLVAWMLSPGDRGFRQLKAALLSPTGILVLFLTGWAGLSLVWTPFATGPAERYFKTLSIFLLAAAAASLLPERTKTSNLYLLPIGVALSGLVIVALAVLEPARFGRPYNPDISLIDRSAFGLTLLVWPAIGALVIREKSPAAIALAFVVIVAELAARTPLALAATAVGILVFTAASMNARLTGRIMGILGALLFIGAPLFAMIVYWIVPVGQSPNALLSSIVWADILQKDGIHTLIGHGFDSARQGVRASYLHRFTPQSMLFTTWFELGVVGVGAAALLSLLLAWRAAMASKRLAPYLLAGLASAFVLCAFGLGVSAVWWVTLLALDGFAFTLLRHGHARNHRPGVADIESKTRYRSKF